MSWLIWITGIVVCAFFVLWFMSLMIVLKQSDKRIAEMDKQADDWMEDRRKRFGKSVGGYDRKGREL